MSDAFRSDVEAQRSRADALEAELVALRAENVALRSGAVVAPPARPTAAPGAASRWKVALAIAAAALAFGAGGAMLLLGRGASQRHGSAIEETTEALDFREVHRTGLTLRAAARRDGTMLVVGDGGLIARARDGGPFAREATAVAYALHGATLGGDGYAVGEHGTILRFDADRRAWLQESSGTTEPLFAVAAAPAEPVIAVGARGVVLVRNERGEWREVARDGDESLFAVAATGGRAPYTAVGERGVVLGAHVSYGEKPHLTRQTLDARATLRAIALQGGDVWIGGDDGRVFRASAAGTSGWTAETPPAAASIRALCAIDVMTSVRSPSSTSVGPVPTLLVLGSGPQAMLQRRRDQDTWRLLPASRVTPPHDVVAAHCSGDAGVLVTEHAVYRAGLVHEL